MPSPVHAHFHGGPLDGEIRAVEEAPYEINVPQLAELRYDLMGVDEIVPTRTVIYRIRGPVLAENAYYDWVPDA